MGSLLHKTKVIPNTLNPKWNSSMQFPIKSVEDDVLCFTVFDQDRFSPNGRLSTLTETICAYNCFTKQKKALTMVTEMKTSLKSYHELFTGTKQASMPHEAKYISHSKVGHS